MIMASISYQDITVVFQGPVYGDLTSKCLDSIKKCLPGSRVILSTAAASDVSSVIIR